MISKHYNDAFVWGKLSNAFERSSFFYRKALLGVADEVGKYYKKIYELLSNIMWMEFDSGSFDASFAHFSVNVDVGIECVSAKDAFDLVARSERNGVI